MNVKLQLIILVICFFLMNKFDNAVKLISEYASFARYTESQVDTYSSLENTTYAFGFRMYLTYFAYIVAIIYSNKMNRIFNSKYFTVCYNLFFIGICLMLVFYNDFTMSRLLYYFICFMPIVVSALFFYLWRNKQYGILSLLIVVLLMRTLYDGYDNVVQLAQQESFLYKFDL